ncbi:AHH domain-containing protein [Dyella sp.]|jgi:hypothetical protein|uniref:AHH domain-containing protein n=1 Tax=Dyella sp. TaxID=1869338 RepID=UPI002D778B1D|nr:AHH domain-containing protein [Dyella sp.]HET6433805.1 AHH domain-containing protein [Dyella sp.]
MDRGSRDAGAPAEYTTTEILDLTVEANLVTAPGAGINTYELRNELLQQRRLARVRYKNGVTLPASAKKLRADANRKARHSRTLARNVSKATGTTKHAQADAHHIVAAADKRAARSRSLLFRWGIGINDADNGVFLPKNWSFAPPGLEEATAHEVIHTTAYHLAVTARLALTKPSNQTNGRLALQDIRYDILHDDFEY